MTAIRGWFRPTADEADVAVHSLDQFVLTFRMSRWPRILTPISVSTCGDGNALGIKTFGHEHRWGPVVEGVQGEGLHHLSFGSTPKISRGSGAAREDDVSHDRSAHRFESNGCWFHNQEGALIEVKVAPKVWPERKTRAVGVGAGGESPCARCAARHGWFVRGDCPMC